MKKMKFQWLAWHGGRQTSSLRWAGLPSHQPPHLTTTSIVVNKTVIVWWIFNFLLFHRIRYFHTRPSTMPCHTISPFAPTRISFYSPINFNSSQFNCYTFYRLHRTIIIIMIEKFVFCCIFVSLPSYIYDDGIHHSNNVVINNHVIHHHIQFFSSFVHIIQYNSIFFRFFLRSFSLYACIQLFVHFVWIRSTMQTHTHPICIIE